MNRTSPLRHSTPLILAAAGSLLLTGCPRNEYIVEMTPDGDALERTLICQRYDIKGELREPQDFPEPELAALKSVYSRHDFDEANKRHTFRGRSTGATPKDVGGAGSYTRWITSLGSVGIYTERCRGQDDQWARLQRRAKSADQFVNLLLGWLKTELGREEGWGKLRQFIDERFRHDLMNGNLMAYQAELAERIKTGAENEFAVRAGQYFYERGYFQREDLPRLLSLLRGSNQETEALEFARRWLAERMAVTAASPRLAALDFLKNPDATKASWGEFIRKQEFFKARLKAWEADANKDPAAEPPDPADVGLEPALAAFDLQSETPDELKVRLHLPSAPFFSNGQWDAAKHQVVWETTLEIGQPHQLPAICYATWSEPNTEVQTLRFGKVALSGQGLFDYTVWRLRLAASDGAKWDDFLNGLKPGPDLKAKLESFRFVGESAESPSKAADAVALIQSGL